MPSGGIKWDFTINIMDIVSLALSLVSILISLYIGNAIQKVDTNTKDFGKVAMRLAAAFPEQPKSKLE